MAGEQHRTPALAKATDEGTHLRHPGRVHPVRRLVEDEELRILEQRAGDAEPLLHAERVGREPVAGPPRQVDLLQHPRDPCLEDTGVPGEEAQVVAAGKEWVEGGRFDEGTDPGEPVRRAGSGAEHHGAP
jgi:hypothetical protein